MLKKISETSGIKKLSKAEQNRIKMGRPSSGLFFCQFDCSEGDRCAFPDGQGGVIFGTIQNGRCVAG